MSLNKYGKIARDEWIKTETLRENVRLDEFVIMPNHMHGIIQLVDVGGIDPLKYAQNNRGPVHDRGKHPDHDPDRRDTAYDGIKHPVDKPNRRDTARRVPAGNDGNVMNVNTNPEPVYEQFGQPTKNSIPTIVRSYKSAVTQKINRINGQPGNKIWQRNYYERIIRNESALNRIREYIRRNPETWNTDSFNH